MNPYMTIQECSEYIKPSVKTLYRKSHKKEIPVRKHGSKLVFYKDEIDAWSLSKAKPLKEKTLSVFQQARERVRGGRGCS